MTLDTELHILLRVVVAMVLSTAIGWERERVGKEAGLRTLIFVGMGSTLFIAIGELLVQRFAPYQDLTESDPIRIVQAIVIAVSFLGSGTFS